MAEERLTEPKAPFAYPEGHKPSWWACDECKLLWHDAWQESPDACSWEEPAECGRCSAPAAMRMVSSGGAARLHRQGYRAEGRRLRVTS